MTEKKRRPWVWAWLSWLALGLVLEGIALVLPSKDDTLTEQVWNLQDWLRAQGGFGQLGFVAFTIGLVGFLGWLILHFTTRKV